MSEPFLAEIRIFAGNFAPRGWAFCDGQLLPISQNTALYSLIGTTYGGDGRTTTALPNMQGRAPMHPGTGPGLTSRRIGQKSGAETVTLNAAQLPSHNHQVQGLVARGGGASPQGNSLNNSGGGQVYTQGASGLGSMGSDTILSNGSGQAHNNMQPYLTLSFIIALVGLYPSKS